MKQRIISYLNSHNNEVQGILWMLYGCFWFASMASIVKYLTFDMDPFVLVFFRSIFALVCILPGLHKYGIHKIKSKNIRFYFTRAITGTAGMVLVFLAIAKLPITTVTALTFTVPLITSIFAVIYLNEKLKKHNVIALLCGFAGILIILRPGTETFQATSLLVIGAACFWSISNILIKKLTKTEDPTVIVYLMIIIMAPLSLPIALFTWQTPDTTQLLLLFLLAFVSNQAQFSLAHAYSKADMSTVLPFDYTRMIFIAIMAYFFFGEIIDFYTAIGSIVIFLSGLYLIKHQRKKSPPVIDSGETLT